uniref:Uncharacterized protein n=1 Tax=Anguilla anguilla TaxID=7936 RepID=A0A0E9R7T3_ANGAN
MFMFSCLSNNPVVNRCSHSKFVFITSFPHVLLTFRIYQNVHCLYLSKVHKWGGHMHFITYK